MVRKSVGQSGTGPGPITADGSPVELYLAASDTRNEDQLIDAAIDPGSTILELGCGTGRITRPLVELGHHVTAVDESPDMLAAIDPGTETVRSTIEELRLDRRFDVVLLMSFLINVPDDDTRHRMLLTCAHHVRPGGAVILQQQDPEAFRESRVLENEHRRLAISDVQQLPGNRQSVTMTYTIGDHTWSHHIVVQNLTEPELTAQLTAAGLTLDTYLTADHTWLRAHPL